MALPVYSKTFGAYQHSGSAVDHNVYTVPTGKVAILRCAALSLDAGAHVAYFGVVAKPWVVYVPIGAGPDSRTWNGRIVLDAGDTLRVSVDTGGWWAVFSGYEFNA